MALASQEDRTITTESCRPGIRQEADKVLSMAPPGIIIGRGTVAQEVCSVLQLRHPEAEAVCRHYLFLFKTFEAHVGNSK